MKDNIWVRLDGRNRKVLNSPNCITEWYLAKGNSTIHIISVSFSIVNLIAIYNLEGSIFNSRDVILLGHISKALKMSMLHSKNL